MLGRERERERHRAVSEILHYLKSQFYDEREMPAAIQQPYPISDVASAKHETRRNDNRQRRRIHSLRQATSIAESDLNEIRKVLSRP